MIFLVLTLISSVIFEANFTTLPITFAFILFWTVVLQRSEIFLIAFLAGILLDLLSFNSLGISSAFFLLAMLTTFLYRSKFEIKTIWFVGVFCFFGSLIYMSLRGSENIFFGSLLTSFITAISFKVYQTYLVKE